MKISLLAADETTVKMRDYLLRDTDDYVKRFQGAGRTAKKWPAKIPYEASIRAGRL